jgi:hypothetical protein
MEDSDELKRVGAGEYRTADERFTVRNEGGRWFLVDAEQADELGQELIRGPYATREEAGHAIAAARSEKVSPRARPKATARTRSDASKTKPASKPKPKLKPKPASKPSWIDRLPASEASRVRAQIRALEKLGLSDAETLVRRDREGLAPAIAQRLIERELAALTADLPAAERKAAERLVRRAVAIVAGRVGVRDRALPGWRLVEIGPEPEPANRRIVLPD